MRPRKIVHDIALDIGRGCALGLVGPNGAGKTTTIKLGAGLLRPETGQVSIFGRPAPEAASRKCLGLLTENQYIYPHLRLREWLVMLAGFSGLSARQSRQRLEAVLSAVDLTARADQMMHTLSKGQLQRAGLAQALIHEPEILFLDEPMSGLDPYWRYQVQQMLSDFKSRGGTILFSSHILADVERLSDSIALLEEGRICWRGNLSELSRNIKGYEALCRTDQTEILEKISVNGKPELQSEGGWRVSVPVDRKDELIRLASQGTITLDSLRPVREELEEILFRFTSRPAK
ncbi:ABC transporter ATP-binding protein [Desulfonema ishimotonii]|nr:ABC transporter ATP-binding protein [Desulfonema ishimotonii]